MDDRACHSLKQVGRGWAPLVVNQSPVNSAHEWRLSELLHVDIDAHPVSLVEIFSWGSQVRSLLDRNATCAGRLRRLAICHHVDHSVLASATRNPIGFAFKLVAPAPNGPAERLAVIDSLPD